MNGSYINRLHSILAVLAVAILTSGCLAAAAGAGAAAAIHMSGNSAQSQVQGSVAAVDQRTRAVFADMGIQVETRTEKPNGFEYRGTADGREISVDIEAVEGGMTQVTASARRSPVEWDNDYAREIVQRIVARS